MRPDGSPSPTLARRIALAIEAAHRFPQATLFLSGALGRHAPSEAAVMTATIAPHVGSGRLVLDEESNDTLQTALAAARYARANGVARCIVCTDRYHQPRARMLLRLFGVPAHGYWFERPRRPTAWRYRWRMRLREAAALPYDAVAGLAAVRRARREAR